MSRMTSAAHKRTELQSRTGGLALVRDGRQRRLPRWAWRNMLAGMASVVLAAALAACDDVSCPLNNTVASVYNFYASARDADGVFHAGAAVSVGDTITVTATGTDEVLVNKKYAVATLSLPVSFYAAADTLIWTFTDTQNRHAADTIVVVKTNRHHFDDPSCPAHMWHHIDSVAHTRNVIDTVLIANADVNYDGLENIQIYFRTDDTTDGTDDTTDDDDDTTDGTDDTTATDADTTATDADDTTAATE